jgi:UDP-N-acetylmuramoyl-L-alanyl-D-glutamate--2,6-diaminopimelate ligase
MALERAPTSLARLRSVGVTGTNGKTTTTTWIARALATLATPVACVTTLGHFLGADLVDESMDYASFLRLMEACVARGGVFAALEITSESLANGFARAWPCEVGVFTNLTQDHLDAHGSPEHYLASKAQLFCALPTGGTAVLNGCDESFDLLREIVPEGVRALAYGAPGRGEERGPLDVRARAVRVGWDGTRVLCEGPAVGGARELHVGAIGDVFAENAMAALLGSLAMGVPLDGAIRALAGARAPPGRFEVVGTAPRVVVDYAHTPDAVARTCATARALTPAGAALIVVFGAGGNRDRAKRAPMGEAARCADRVILTSDNPRDEDPGEIARQIALGLVGHPGVTLELDRRRAIERAIGTAARDDVVLVCGKGHERTQTVAGQTTTFSDAEVARELCGQLPSTVQPPSVK